MGEMPRANSSGAAPGFRAARWAGSLLLGLGLAAMPGAAVWAHGGADGWENDSCAVQRGDRLLHFSAYQYADNAAAAGAGTARALPEQYCDALPRTGKAAIVVDLVSAALRSEPVSMKVTEEHGARTVLELPPQTYRAGVLRADAVFDEKGRYTVVLTAGSDTFAFPLAVGQPAGFLGPWEIAAWAIGFALIGAGYWIHRRRQMSLTAAKAHR